MYLRWNRKAIGHREQKSQLPTTLDGGHRDDGLWSMVSFLDRKDKFSVLIREQGKDRVHADTWWMGSDDEVGATRESQQNNEQSDSGNQRKEKGSRRSQRPRSDHCTDGLVRIMGFDPFRRPNFSP